MIPERKHSNLGDNVHGAVSLALVDIALFAASHQFGSLNAGHSVTLDLSTQFVGAGRIGEPLDAVVELVRETGRLIFRSEEHPSELPSLMRNSYAVFCLQKKNIHHINTYTD